MEKEKVESDLHSGFSNLLTCNLCLFVVTWCYYVLSLVGWRCTKHLLSYVLMINSIRPNNK